MASINDALLLGDIAGRYSMTSEIDRQITVVRIQLDRAFDILRPFVTSSSAPNGTNRARLSASDRVGRRWEIVLKQGERVSD